MSHRVEYRRRSLTWKHMWNGKGRTHYKFTHVKQVIWIVTWNYRKKFHEVTFAAHLTYLWAPTLEFTQQMDLLCPWGLPSAIIIILCPLFKGDANVQSVHTGKDGILKVLWMPLLRPSLINPVGLQPSWLSLLSLVFKTEWWLWCRLRIWQAFHVQCQLGSRSQ